MKRIILAFIIASLAVAAGCSGKSSTGSEAAASSGVEPVVQADGSTLMVVETEVGIKSEVKTFPGGIFAQVSRTTRPDGRRNAAVKLRNGYAVELQDRNDIDRAIEMSNDELLAALKKIPGAAEYATAPPPPPAVTTPPETAPAVKKEEKPQPAKVLNEGTPSKAGNKTKPATSKKRE